VLLATDLSSKVTLGGTGYVLVLDGLGAWFGSMMRRDEDGAIRLDANGVPERWHWGLILPSGMGVEFIGKVVRGGGYIYRTDHLQAALPESWGLIDDPVFPDEERYAGLLNIKIHDFEAIAFGIHEVLPDKATSTIIVMGIRNKPGIQLPLGFRLIGIGGILGINRRADLDAFKQFMSIGATGSILITDDPVRNAPIILGDLEFLFPIENRVFVFGPTFRLVWLSDDIVQIDLALVIEYGSGSADAASQGLTKIVIFGTVRAKKEADGRKLLNLQIDILGVIDPAKRTFALDGNLVNSKVLEAFSATGNIGARFFVGDSDTLPYAMIAVGGFHPRFNPEPARFEKMKRIGLAYKGRGSDKIKISAEAYVAFTVLTLQHGAKLTVRIKAGSVSAEGLVAYDVLIQFIPFYFDVGLAQSGALDPVAVVSHANTCPPLPEVFVPGLPHIDVFANDNGLPTYDELVAIASKPGFVFDPGSIIALIDEVIVNLPLPTPAVIEFLEALKGCVEQHSQNLDYAWVIRMLLLCLDAEMHTDGAFLEEIARFDCEAHVVDDPPRPDPSPDFDPPDRPCVPVVIGTLDGTLTDAINPTGDHPGSATSCSTRSTALTTSGRPRSSPASTCRPGGCCVISIRTGCSPGWGCSKRTASMPSKAIRPS
jgi:hypothetical protein